MTGVEEDTGIPRSLQKATKVTKEVRTTDLPRFPVFCSFVAFVSFCKRKLLTFSCNISLQKEECLIEACAGALATWPEL